MKGNEKSTISSLSAQRRIHGIVFHKRCILICKTLQDHRPSAHSLPNSSQTINAQKKQDRQNKKWQNVMTYQSDDGVSVVFSNGMNFIFARSPGGGS